VQVSSNTTAQPNTHYEVNATSASVIDVLLPENVTIGDVVSVRGVSGNAWRVLPNSTSGPTARAAFGPQYVVTTNLNGNVAPGQNWTARLAPKQWHWVTSDSRGSVLVAADIPGNLHVSLDGGTTWNTGSSPTANWISVAIERVPSQSGDHQFQMAAVAYGGGLYRSSNGGPWTQVTSTDPAVNLSNREWESVTVNPGGYVVGAIMNGPIYYNHGNDGTSWSAATAVGSTTPLVRAWRALAKAGLTGIMVAANQDGEVWVSADGGRTWTSRDVAIGGAPVYNQWYRAAISADGNTIVVGGRFNSGLYISRDRGLNWSQASAPVGDYTAVSMSSDGQVIGATITNGATAPTTGSVQVSRDGGASFSALPMPGTDTNWRAFAMSADGNMFTVAAGTFGAATGQLYTSVGNRTSLHPYGSITGGQNDYIELEYQGGFNTFKWGVRTSAGGPFTIR